MMNLHEKIKKKKNTSPSAGYQAQYQEQSIARKMKCKDEIAKASMTMRWPRQAAPYVLYVQYMYKRKA